MLAGRDALEQGQAESGGFAVTRLGECDDVVIGLQGHRDDQFLYGGGVLEAEGLDALQEVVLQA